MEQTLQNARSPVRVMRKWKMFALYGIMPHHFIFVISDLPVQLFASFHQISLAAHRIAVPFRDLDYDGHALHHDLESPLRQSKENRQTGKRVNR
jgi:hypothetical protein